MALSHHGQHRLARGLGSRGDGRSAFTRRRGVSLSEGAGVMMGFWRAGGCTGLQGQAEREGVLQWLGQATGEAARVWGGGRLPRGPLQAGREGTGRARAAEGT